MIFKITLLLCAIFVLFRLVENLDQKTRFKSVKCFSNATEYLTIHACKVKVTRNSSAIVINTTIFKPIDKPLYNYGQAFYKYGQIYRPVFRLPELELCSALKAFDNGHPIMKVIIDVLGKSFEPIVRGCPFVGQYNLSVEVDDNKLPSIFPSGMYKEALTLKKNDKIFQVEFQLEVVSSIKTSF
jgi:Protein of unknown function (DUF1091)